MSEYLPPEVITQILIRLPVESVVKCTAVCKAWYNLIKDPSFISGHLEAASASPSPHSDLLLLRLVRYGREVYQLRRDNDALEAYKQFLLPFVCGDGYFTVVCTCNGLICLADLWDIILWNPSIHKHFILPMSVLSYGLTSLSTLGFGFDSRTNDYKVLLFVPKSSSTENLTEVWLFSLNGCYWKKVSEIYPKHDWSRCKQAIVKGAFHWTTCSFNSNGDLFSHMILAFDISTEKFYAMDYPETLVHFAHEVLLTKYEDSIAVVTQNFDDGQIELWVMKDYGESSSWTKVLHSIDENGELVFGVECIDVFGVRKNGEVLLKVEWVDEDDYDLATLNLKCHQQEQELKLVHGNKVEYDDLFVGSFMESLVLLDIGQGHNV
ncbi:unnamed protein product [Cuscuta campestris]|uniref:F-box domain-containing protein n=2 Tax=Cuscuta sect. Cleistogrammica TaxID=1824901 RepID=A0A484NG89_9ASTE|nr:hypothetical protein DM860_012077 [Cuscuta australis]VFR00472.1 unnamed protein product [Cuscuta campestris]